MYRAASHYFTTDWFQLSFPACLRLGPRRRDTGSEEAMQLCYRPVKEYDRYSSAFLLAPTSGPSSSSGKHLMLGRLMPPSWGGPANPGLPKASSRRQQPTRRQFGVDEKLFRIGQVLHLRFCHDQPRKPIMLNCRMQSV